MALPYDYTAPPPESARVATTPYDYAIDAFQVVFVPASPNDETG